MNLNAIVDEFNDYEKYMKWNEVFQNLKFDTNAINFTFKTARHPSNQKYNRYRDILPYDHSRVILQDANNVDYINANIVECKLANRKYILTQGPLLSTCEHFWQMVWEQNTRGIIMLNHIIEKGKPKCEVYYPNVDEENCDLEIRFGKFNISYSSEQPFEDYVFRKLEIENLDLKEVREVYHCQYTNWPDFGEPEDTESFLRFLNECDNLHIFETDDENSLGPAVIHCSAGVGRSGTMVLVDSVHQLYKKYGDNMPLSIIDVLCELRSYRMGLVQTHQQLKFAYKSIIDGIQQIKQQEGNDGDVYKASPVNHTNTKRSYSATSSSANNNNNNDGDDDSDEEENQYREKLRMRKQRLLEFQQKTDQQQQQPQQKEQQDKENNSKRFKKSSSSSKNSKKLDDSDSDENDNENNNDDDTSDSNEFLFARSDRDVGTVKVNKPRVPLLEQQQQQQQQLESKITVTPSTSAASRLEKPQLNVENNSDNNPQNTLTKRNVSSAKSDKDERIANLVKTMKEKQRLHEQSKNNSKLNFINTYKPYLVSGGIIIAGFLFIKFYKTFISSN